MKKKTFAQSVLSAAIVAGIAATASVVPQQAQAMSLIEDSSVNAGVYLFSRSRDRKDESGQTDEYGSDLSHSSTQASVDFTSGYAGGIVGFDLGAYAAVDVGYADDATRNQEHEFNFAGKRWGELYEDGKTSNGAAYTKAALKAQTRDGNSKVRAGYTQLYVPGVIGVNWSYQPGTYRGTQFETNVGELYFTYAWADEYKAPWFEQTGKFSRVNAWDAGATEGDNVIDYIHGAAARYGFANGTQMTLSFGQSAGFTDAYHGKLAHTFDVGEGIATSYQFYGSSNDEIYDGLAQTHAFTSATSLGDYSFRFEGMHTIAKGLGTYLPRLTRGFGNSQGAQEIWWDSRSDWNNDGETALFLAINRDLGFGWSAGISGAHGFGATTADGSDSTGSESAVNLDLAYAAQNGFMEGTIVKLHYTNYINHQDDKGSWYYSNMFTSEQDIKLLVIKPFNLK